jgi:hypothetical protein
MTGTLFLCAVLTFAADPSATVEPRRFHDLERDISTTLRRESLATDLVERGAAVRQLAVLFRELDNDPRLLESPTLQEYRGRVRARLVFVQKRLERDIARGQAQQRHDAQRVTPELDLKMIRASEEQQQLAREITAQLSLVGYSQGGPGHVFEAAGGAYGGGAVVGDYGEELVDLIQRTIYPAKWDVAGGPCTIVYYRPLMCLVVTATGDVHGGVGGLLDGVRKAGP